MLDEIHEYLHQIKQIAVVESLGHVCGAGIG